jgi:hypothetical protein
MRFEQVLLNGKPESRIVDTGSESGQSYLSCSEYLATPCIPAGLKDPLRDCDDHME